MHEDDPSRPSSLGELLERQAGRRGDAEALTDGTSRLTWEQYRDRAAALAGALAAAGAGPGDPVGIHLQKSVDAFVAAHAVLRLGGIVVPVDWFAPAAYAEGVLDDVGAQVVVSDPARPGADVTGGGRRRIVAPTAAAAPAPLAPRGPDDDAYVVYTSGSTGRPKGIVHTNASALAYAERAVATYDLGPEDRLANIAPLHFDQSTFELYAAPLAGASVVVVPDAVLRFPASVSQLAATERITVWYSVPHAVIQLVTRGALADRDLRSLRWVLYGGESFAAPRLAEAMRALPGARFSNVYGPAEVNQCTFHHLAAPPADDEVVPIGQPWEGVELMVVDEEGTPVDDGTAGELWVSADTMMDRYWGRPDLTAAAIVGGPAGDGPARRWYRTGDRARRRPDGDLEFLGRLDHQVKVRGYRIELEAIETLLAAHDSVRACTVVVERGEIDRIVAVVEPPPDEATRQALQTTLRQRLPRYAVPAEIVGAAALPRTVSGKVDRAASLAMVGTHEVQRAGPGDR